jgi:hypothetical protein
MEIHYKKLYLVSYGNYTYSRINNKWHICTGGRILDWREVNARHDPIPSTELEKLFQRELREEKLKRLLNEKLD